MIVIWNRYFNMFVQDYLFVKSVHLYVKLLIAVPKENTKLIEICICFIIQNIYISIVSYDKNIVCHRKQSLY